MGKQKASEKVQVKDGKGQQQQRRVTITKDKIEVKHKPNIAIVGFANTRHLAPYDDPTWECWGVNELYMVPEVKRIDVLFELHDYAWLQEGKRNKEHVKWLKNAKMPIYMQKRFKDIPMSVPFPKDMLVERYGHYFTNTISWQIALAMLLKVKKIGLWGVNMATDVEYSSQRPSVEYFVGLARGMGIDVYVPPESDLLKCGYLYGFEDGELSIFCTKMDNIKSEAEGLIGSLNPQIQNLVARVNQAVGKRDTVNYIKNAFIYPNGNFIAEDGKKAEEWAKRMLAQLKAMIGEEQDAP